MDSDRQNASLDKQLEQIRTQLVQIKMLLAGALILVLLLLFGPGEVLDFLGTSVVVAGIVLAVGYLLLLVLERLLRWKIGPNRDEELKKRILEDFESKEQEETG